jgi:hypothetical protein
MNDMSGMENAVMAATPAMPDQHGGAQKTSGNTSATGGGGTGMFSGKFY